MQRIRLGTLNFFSVQRNLRLCYMRPPKPLWVSSPLAFRPWISTRRVVPEINSEPGELHKLILSGSVDRRVIAFSPGWFWTFRRETCPAPARGLQKRALTQHRRIGLVTVCVCMRPHTCRLLDCALGVCGHSAQSAVESAFARPGTCGLCDSGSAYV